MNDISHASHQRFLGPPKTKAKAQKVSFKPPPPNLKDSSRIPQA
jgi:hypothetical protein